MLKEEHEVISQTTYASLCKKEQSSSHKYRIAQRNMLVFIGQ